VAIHPTALVAPGAEIDPSCEIGPYAVIGPKVKLGPRSTVGAHAVLDGDTTLGAGNRIFPHAAIGGIPQDLKYAGEATKLVIGDGNQFREFCTVHIGTAGGGGVTRIGDGCLVMANAHVAHDVQIGDGCILANCATLGGHVIVEDRATIGGLSAAHQFTRIGRNAFVSGMTGVVMDVAPYCTVSGSRAELAGVNVVGLQRAGYGDEQIGRIKEAYRIVFRARLDLQEALSQLRSEMGTHAEIAHLIRFLEDSGRGITR
jgi:UDP-N-acetylglucosamine acyltransferase